MKKNILIFFFALITMQVFAQADNTKSNRILEQDTSIITYRLYPTQNMWTFIKLNTKNGQLWQVQYDVKGINRLVTTLSSERLVSKEKEVNDRFTLYPTQNIYTFILLDQIDGRTWQVQWSIDEENRGIIPIEKID